MQSGLEFGNNISEKEQEKLIMENFYDLRRIIRLKRRLLEYVEEHRKMRSCPFRPSLEAVREHRRVVKDLEDKYLANVGHKA